MLVINEVLVNPAVVGDMLGEWIELYNPGPVALDLRGFVLRDLGTETHTINATLPVTVSAGGLIVLGNNSTHSTNGNVNVNYQFSSFVLSNSADEIIIAAHGVELDRVVYSASIFVTSGKSVELGLNQRTYLLNDDLANWCQATAPFGAGDYGTPGLPNLCPK
jgi:hypothetical protein